MDGEKRQHQSRSEYNIRGFIMRSNLMIAILILAFAGISEARSWHVPGEAPTIQAGIDSAQAGDTVEVACGTYYEHDIVMKSGITLTSETGMADCVTIDAQQIGRVFVCHDVDENTALIGLTITGGAAMVGGLDDYGAGVSCESASAAFSHCTFRLNTAFSRGGGLHVGGASAITLADCVFDQNETLDGPGGALVSYSPVQISNCRFIDNQACADGGTAMFGGSCSIEIVACLFSGNVASVSRGGGVCIVEDVSVTFDRCSFLANSSAEKGGGLYVEGSGLKTLLSCSFNGNSTDGSGGGVALMGANLLAENTDIIGNLAPLGADGYIGGGTAMLQCCRVDMDLWFAEFGGIINLDNSDCGIHSQVLSWGAAKSFYR
jgi:predicted outer membrane repeat protein